MEEPQFIISFDVGIKNLALCILEIPKKEKPKENQNDDTENAEPNLPAIHHLELLNLMGPNDTSAKSIPLPKLIESLVKTLDNLSLKFSAMQNPFAILIENQPKFNVKMKSISLCIFTYFVMRCVVDRPTEMQPKIELVHARHKIDSMIPILNIHLEPCQLASEYAKRKWTAIHLTRKCLDEQRNKEWLSFFEKLKKKDDIADAYLQGLWYCLTKTNQNTYLNTVSNKGNPRKKKNGGKRKTGEMRQKIA